MSSYNLSQCRSECLSSDEGPDCVNKGERAESVSISDSDSGDVLHDALEKTGVLPSAGRLRIEGSSGVACEEEDAVMDADYDDDEDEGPSPGNLLSSEKEASPSEQMDDLKLEAVARPATPDFDGIVKERTSTSARATFESACALRRSDRLRKTNTEVASGVKKAPKKRVRKTARKAVKKGRAVHVKMGPEDGYEEVDM